jgi:hypothetical protein
MAEINFSAGLTATIQRMKVFERKTPETHGCFLGRYFSERNTPNPPIRQLFLFWVPHPEDAPKNCTL